jgi:hypothetical protein
MNESSEIRQDDPLDSSVEKPSSMPEEHQPINADALLSACRQQGCRTLKASLNLLIESG